MKAGTSRMKFPLLQSVVVELEGVEPSSKRPTCLSSTSIVTL